MTSAWPADASPATTSPLLTPVRIAICTPHWRWSSPFRRCQLLLQLERGPHRAPGVVLEGRRDPEDRHHGVADELLDRAPVALDDRRGGLEVAQHHPPHGLGLEALAQRRSSPRRP